MNVYEQSKKYFFGLFFEIIFCSKGENKLILLIIKFKVILGIDRTDFFIQKNFYLFA